MQIDLSNILNNNDIVAVALSGGCDSMCLLHFLREKATSLGFSVIALNVEHGIRGESSIKDTEFVKDYCAKHHISLLTYAVDALKYAKENKLSIEQSARALRYDCFNDALKNKKCTKVATAHHQDDNVETVLFNLFRGTGLKGLTGIQRERQDNIIRPFLSVNRIELEQYAKANNIPFVVDETNFKDDYTRNFLRHNVLPKIREVFPELNKSIERISQIASQDDEYINGVAEKQIKINDDSVSIAIPCPNAVLSRAVIIALKAMGVKKDWEKTHVDQVIELTMLENGTKLSMPKGITAIKEYDKIVFYKENLKSIAELPFAVGKFEFLGKTITVEKQTKDINLKNGLFLDLDKIPKTAVLRTRKDGDIFTKFGGGTKLLNDYFTDKKVPSRRRDEQILIADGNQVLAILGLAISEKVKVEKNTKNIISFK